MASESARAPKTGYAMDLGTAATIRIRGTTRVRGRLVKLSSPAPIRELEGTLQLKGLADNLIRPEPGKLTWLLKRADGRIQEVSHDLDVTIVPTSTEGRLKGKPFDVKELVPAPPPPPQPDGQSGKAGPPTPRDVGWRVFSIGLYGEASVGFRFQPTRPSVETMTIAPEESDLALTIPLSCEVFADDLASPIDPAALRVGTTVGFKVKAGTIFDPFKGHLRIWENETAPDSEKLAPEFPGSIHVWDIVPDASETKTFRLGVATGGLVYTRDYSDDAKLTFHYELSFLNGDGSAIDRVRPACSGTLGSAPSPTLTQWDLLAPVAADGASTTISASTRGGLLFPVTGQITNLAPDFGITLEATLYTRTMVTGNKGGEIAKLSPVGSSVPIAFHASNREGSPTPGTVEAPLRADEHSLDRLRANEKNGVFAVLAFPTGTTNRNQPFAQLIGYQANMTGDGKDVGFAPIGGNELALLETGSGVCTANLIEVSGHCEILESDAVPRKAPPAWVGDPWTPITVQDIYADLAPWEGVVGHMYRDNAEGGYMTVGVGNLIKDKATALTYQFWNMDEGRPATEAEVSEGWDKVRTMDRALPSSVYKQTPNIALPRKEIIALFEKRYPGFYNACKTSLPEFETYPRSARRGIFEMIYALGAGKLEQQFTKFKQAVIAGDWKEAAKQCLHGHQEKRTEWRESLFLYAQECVDRKKALAGAAPGAPAATGASGSS